MFGGYIQDDWRVRRRLTLNIGLRYEMATVPNEVHGQLTSLAAFSDPLPQCGTANPDLTTVLGKPGCAGCPLFTPTPPPAISSRASVLPGIRAATEKPRFAAGSRFRRFAAPRILLPPTKHSHAVSPSGRGYQRAGTIGRHRRSGRYSGSAFSKMTANSLYGVLVENHPPRSYVEQWNINVQRQLSASLTATVGYIGSHGVHQLFRGDDANMVIPTQTSAGYLWPYNPNKLDLRINPKLGPDRFMLFNNDTSYHSFQVNVQKRMSHGFQFGGAYTYRREWTAVPRPSPAIPLRIPSPLGFGSILKSVTRARTSMSPIARC